MNDKLLVSLIGAMAATYAYREMQKPAAQAVTIGFAVVGVVWLITGKPESITE